MEDFGDILFYIIAAVIGLATTLGKKKKKKREAPVPSETETTEDLEDSIIQNEEFNGVEYQVDDDNFVLESPYSHAEPMAEQFVDEGKAQFIKEDKKEKGEKEEKLEEEKEDILSDFDLRKAVIFSEILDRKDY